MYPLGNCIPIAATGMASTLMQMYRMHIKLHNRRIINIPLAEYNLMLCPQNYKFRKNHRCHFSHNMMFPI